MSFDTRADRGGGVSVEVKDSQSVVTVIGDEESVRVEEDDAIRM